MKTPAKLVDQYRIARVPGGKLLVPNPSRIPDADKAAIMQQKAAIIEELARREAERQASISEVAQKRNAATIRLVWFDGERLGAWQAADVASQRALEHLGLGEDIGGWGWHVPAHVVDALGTEFGFEQAKAYLASTTVTTATAPDNAMAQAKAEAKATGRPVVAYSTTVPCDGTVEECSEDTVTTVAHPDGSVRHHRAHTH